MATCYTPLGESTNHIELSEQKLPVVTSDRFCNKNLFMCVWQQEHL